MVIFEPCLEISNNVVCVTGKGSDQPGGTRSLCLSLEYSMTVKLLAEQHLEFLSLKGGCTGSSESTLVKCHIVGIHMHWLNHGNHDPIFMSLLHLNSA